MSTPATTTNQLPLLKRLHGKSIAEPFYKKSKLLNKIAKKSDFGGEGKYIHVTVAPTSGGSATFVDALASQNPSTPIRFFVTRKKEYQVFTVENEAVEASKGDPNAVVSILKNESAKALYAFWRSLSRRAQGNGGGAIGQLDTTTTLSSTTAIMRNRTDILGIDLNTQLEFATDDGSAVSPAGRLGAPDRLTVASGIDRNATLPTFVCNAALNTVSGITTSSYMFRRGDYANAMTGFRGYNPVSAPTGGDSFFGVDRSSTDTTRNSGVRFTGSGGSKEETLISAFAEGSINGCEGHNMVVVNALDYRDLLLELGAKRERTSAADGGISYKYLEVYGDDGAVEVVSEPDVPRGYFWVHNLSDLSLECAGECPKMLAGAGGQMLTAYDADAMQGRLGAYGNFFHKNPGNSIIGTW